MEREEQGESHKFLELNKKTLFRLERNDPGVVNLKVQKDSWIEGTGRAIGKCLYLFRISITLFGSEEETWFHELFHGLARNRTIQWLSLSIEDRFPNVDVLHNLFPFFDHNHKLRHFAFSNFTLPHCNSLVLALKKSKNLECVRFTMLGDIDNEAGAALFDSLYDHHNLLSLALIDSPIGKRGCESLARLIRSPASKLRDLVLYNIGLDDGCVAVLANAISMNTTLRELNFSSNGNASSNKSWGAFFSKVFSNPNCGLRTVIFHRNGRGDEAISRLGDALTVNKTVTSLDLSVNRQMTNAGCKQFLKCLKQLHSVLEILDIDSCHVDTETVLAIVMALKCNLGLKKMFIKEMNDRFDMGKVWDAFSGVLCNTSSIEATYFSHHALQGIEIGFFNPGSITGWSTVRA